MNCLLKESNMLNLKVLPTVGEKRKKPNFDRESPQNLVLTYNAIVSCTDMISQISPYACTGRA